MYRKELVVMQPPAYEKDYSSLSGCGVIYIIRSNLPELRAVLTDDQNRCMKNSYGVVKLTYREHFYPAALSQVDTAPR